MILINDIDNSEKELKTLKQYYACAHMEPLNPGLSTMSENLLDILALRANIVLLNSRLSTTSEDLLDIG